MRFNVYVIGTGSFRRASVDYRLSENIEQFFDENPRSCTREGGRLLGVSHMTVIEQGEYLCNINLYNTIRHKVIAPIGAL